MAAPGDSKRPLELIAIDRLATMNDHLFPRMTINVEATRMAAQFDPYYKWLGIPPEEQPANHYQLLGLRQFEADPDVIESAADRQMAHVRSFQNGQRGEHSQKLLNELAAAKSCLLSPQQKASYDKTLEKPAKQALLTAKPLPAEPASPPPTQAEQFPTLANDSARTSAPVFKTNTSSPKKARSQQAKNPLLTGVKVILGGAGGIAAAIVIIWFGMGIDLLGIFSPDENSQPVARSDSEPELHATEQPQPEAESPSPASSTTKPVGENIAPPPAETPAESTESEPDLPETPSETATPVEQPSTEETTALPADSPVDIPPQTLAESPATEATPPTEPAGKPSPPNQEAEGQALAEIGKLYKQNYAEAKTSQQKIALANLMLRSGREKKENLATKYALLRVARDVFNGEGELTGALAAVDALDESFQIDAHAQQAAAFQAASETTLDAESRKALLTKMQPLILELIEYDRFELATPLVQDALSVARKTRDNQVIKVVSEGKKHVDKLAKEYDTIRPMLETLANEPDNGDANLAVGIYYAAHKDDWDKAADHFALSSDMLLKSLVMKEQADPPAALALGDGWWDLATLRSGEESKIFRQRVLEWYPQAWKSAASADRRRIEERVTSVEPTPIDRSQWDAYVNSGDYKWEKRGLNVFETAGDEYEFLVNNLSGIYDNADLRHNQLFNSDFFISFDVKATGEKARVLIIEKASSKPSNASFTLPKSTQWQSVVIRRTGNELNMWLNEQPIEFSYYRASANIVGMLAIKIPNKEFAGVRKLVILE